MRRIVLLSQVAWLAAACGLRAPGPPKPDFQVDVAPAAEISAPLPTAPALPVEEPPRPEPAALLVPTLPAPIIAPEDELPDQAPADPLDVGPFASMADNLATGQPAPNFDAQALGDWTFSLAAMRGSYVLVFPTVVGCGDCVRTLNELALAYPDARTENLKVVILNLYPDDVPESWQGLVELFPDFDFIWGVVSSTDFVVDYQIRSLGTILLVDPDGKLVFRSSFRLAEEDFRQLFDLMAG